MLWLCLWLRACDYVFVVLECVCDCGCGCVLWLRSSREHLGLELVVEVPQRTLGVDGRG